MLTENMFLCHFILLEVAKYTLEVWPAVNISKFNIWQANAQCTGKPAFEQNYFQTRFLLLWNNKGLLIIFVRIFFLQLILMEKTKGPTSLFCPPGQSGPLQVWVSEIFVNLSWRGWGRPVAIMMIYFQNTFLCIVKTPNSGYGQNMRGAESVCQSGLLPRSNSFIKRTFSFSKNLLCCIKCASLSIRPSLMHYDRLRLYFKLQAFWVISHWSLFDPHGQSNSARMHNMHSAISFIRGKIIPFIKMNYY